MSLSYKLALLPLASGKGSERSEETVILISVLAKAYLQGPELVPASWWCLLAFPKHEDCDAFGNPSISILAEFSFFRRRVEELGYYKEESTETAWPKTNNVLKAELRSSEIAFWSLGQERLIALRKDILPHLTRCRVLGEFRLRLPEPWPIRI